MWASGRFLEQVVGNLLTSCVTANFSIRTVLYAFSISELQNWQTIAFIFYIVVV